MTQPCAICGGRGEHVPPCSEVARRSPFAIDWSQCQKPEIPSALLAMMNEAMREVRAITGIGFDMARGRDQSAFVSVTRDGDKLVYTPISAAEFYAIEATTTPTGDQS